MRLKIIPYFLSLALIIFSAVPGISQQKILDTLFFVNSGSDSISVSIQRVKYQEWTRPAILIKKFDAKKRLLSEGEYEADSASVATCFRDPANFNGIGHSSVNYTYDDKSRIKTIKMILTEPLYDEIKLTRYYDQNDSLKKEVMERNFMKEHKLFFYSYHGNCSSEYSKKGWIKAYHVNGEPHKIRYHRKRLDKKTVWNVSGKTISTYTYIYRTYFFFRTRAFKEIEEKVYDRSGNVTGVTLRDRKGRVIKK